MPALRAQGKPSGNKPTLSFPCVDVPLLPCSAMATVVSLVANILTDNPWRQILLLKARVPNLKVMLPKAA